MHANIAGLQHKLHSLTDDLLNTIPPPPLLIDSPFRLRNIASKLSVSDPYGDMTQVTTIEANNVRMMRKLCLFVSYIFNMNQNDDDIYLRKFESCIFNMNHSMHIHGITNSSCNKSKSNANANSIT